MNRDKLNVYNIFDGIEDGVNGFSGMGELSTFISLRGCNLRCDYCNSSKALDNVIENWMEIDEIIDEINQNKVTITGGEPIIQKFIYKLINKILKRDIRVTVETNGTIPIDFSKISGSLSILRFVMDWKLECAKVSISQNKIIEAVSSLRKEDFIKFVIGIEKDYKDAKIYMNYIQEEKGSLCPQFVFVPVWGSVSIFPKVLADWMIRDRLNAQFGIQLHKVILAGSIDRNIRR